MKTHSSFTPPTFYVFQISIEETGPSSREPRSEHAFKSLVQVAHSVCLRLKVGSAAPDKLQLQKHF